MSISDDKEWPAGFVSEWPVEIQRDYYMTLANAEFMLLYQAVFNGARDEAPIVQGGGEVLGQSIPYAFSEHQLYAVLESTVSMFFEYRDQHGKDEDAAQHAAVQEIIKGLDAERELIKHGERVANPLQILP